MLIKKIIIFIILFFQSLTLASQAAELERQPWANLTNPPFSISKSNANETLEDKIESLLNEKKILSAEDLRELTANDQTPSYFIPLSLTNEELITLAAATSLGIVAFHNDKEIKDLITDNHSQTSKTISSVGNFLGSDAVLPISAGAYFLGVLYKDDKLIQVGVFTVGASLATGIIATGVKNVFGRVRPKHTEDPTMFFKNGNTSFYSGHSAQAFTIATVISELYKEDYPVVPWVAYGLATLTTYARVHDNAHWASDVVAGAIAGHLITKLYLSAVGYDDAKRSGLMIYPSYDREIGALIIYFNYVSSKDSRDAFNHSDCGKIEDATLRVQTCLDEYLKN